MFSTKDKLYYIRQLHYIYCSKRLTNFPTNFFSQSHTAPLKALVPFNFKAEKWKNLKLLVDDP